MNSTINRRVAGFAAALTLGLASVASASVSPDFNGKGGVGLEDLQAYMAAFTSRDLAADTNGDGMVSPQDLFTFIQGWVSGYISEPKKTGTDAQTSSNSTASIRNEARDSILR